MALKQTILTATLTLVVALLGVEETVAQPVEPGEEQRTVEERPEMRAILIEANPGLVAVGDLVDILLTRTLDRRLVTSILLQEVQVLAVDQRSNPETGSLWCTVAVDSIEARKLELAQQVGLLSLSPSPSGSIDGGQDVRTIQEGDFPITPGVFPGYDDRPLTRQ